jgi:carboxyl-terminal processing protease
MRSKALKKYLQSKIVFILLTFIFLSASANFTNSQTKDELSPKDRIKVFEKVWDLINDRYYDPKLNGVDWKNVKEKYKPLVEKSVSDEDFYNILKQLTGEMNDAHTRFLTPREANEFKKKEGTTVGVLLTKIEGKTVVEKVLPDSEADNANVRAGMIVRTIDGQTIADKIAEIEKGVGASSSDRATEILVYRRLLSGEPETRVKIGLIDENGEDFEVSLTRKVISQESKVYVEKSDSGIGYISVSSFRAPISDKFKDALLELKDTSGLIIDLRFNGGGNISEVLRMAGFLLNDEYPFGKYLRRDGDEKQKLRDFSAGIKGGQIYSAPVVILVSKYSASGSELFSSGLQEFGRAKIIGSQTCGCLLGISRFYQMKGGGELHISDIGFLSAKGKIYEKIGVTPDKIVGLKINDLRNNIDVGIVEAEKILSGKTKTRQTLTDYN